MRPLITGILGLVVVSSILSAGVFLGLRSQTVVQVLVPPVMPQAKVKVEEGVPSPVVDTHVTGQLAEKVRALMEARRDELVRACLHGEQNVNLELRLIFNDGGKLIGYGVNDPPEESLREAASCVRQRWPDISVDPTGRPTTVQFTLALQ